MFLEFVHKGPVQSKKWEGNKSKSVGQGSSKIAKPHRFICSNVEMESKKEFLAVFHFPLS